ncbi:MAG: 5'-methylthioadenosine/S-adenosylhomocysteine nucleosidase [Clostridiales bacterium]|nr:5'-methylthioadenosine/S-adenosylhomocysteine nucleosidase [Clostridiales bacterium]
MICFVIALKKEAEELLKRAENLKEFNLADKPCYSCTLKGKEVIIAISGIGKVSAALTTQLLIDKYNPDFVFNFGTCGGMNNSVEILNYYLIDKCCQFDFDLRQLDGVPLGYIQEYNTVYFDTYTKGLDFLKTSRVASADRFTNDVNDINSINEIGCSLRDMEAGAIAQVCTSNNVPLVMIKGISDVYGNGTAQEQFYQNLMTVGKGFPDIILKALDVICK